MDRTSNAASVTDLPLGKCLGAPGSGQPEFALVSMLPVGCAVDDENPCACCARPVRGACAVRGTYSSEACAAEAARQIVEEQTVDCSVYTCRVGYVFPVVERGYAVKLQLAGEKVRAVEALDKAVERAESSEARRAAELMRRAEEVRRKAAEPETPEDVYASLRIKAVGLADAFELSLERAKKIEESLDSVLQDLACACTPELRTGFPARLKEAHRRVGVPEADTERLLGCADFSARWALERWLERKIRIPEPFDLKGSSDDETADEADPAETRLAAVRRAMAAAEESLIGRELVDKTLSEPVRRRPAGYSSHTWKTVCVAISVSEKATCFFEAALKTACVVGAAAAKGADGPDAQRLRRAFSVASERARLALHVAEDARQAQAAARAANDIESKAYTGPAYNLMVASQADADHAYYRAARQRLKMITVNVDAAYGHASAEHVAYREAKLKELTEVARKAADRRAKLGPAASEEVHAALLDGAWWPELVRLRKLTMQEEELCTHRRKATLCAADVSGSASVLAGTLRLDAETACELANDAIKAGSEDAEELRAVARDAREWALWALKLRAASYKAREVAAVSEDAEDSPRCDQTRSTHLAFRRAARKADFLARRAELDAMAAREARLTNELTEIRLFATENALSKATAFSAQAQQLAREAGEAAVYLRDRRRMDDDDEEGDSDAESGEGGRDRFDDEDARLFARVSHRSLESDEKEEDEEARAEKDAEFEAIWAEGEAEKRAAEGTTEGTTDESV